MAQQTKTDYEGTFNSVTVGLFKNNTAGDIGADDARTLVENTADSVPFTLDDSYTWPFPQVTASGTDTYTATLSPAITAYVVGQKFQVLFTNANGGASTMAFNGLAALAITKNGATALAAGDIAAGSIKILAYDGTRLQIVGDGGGVGTHSVRTVTGADASVQTDDFGLIRLNSATPFNFTLDELDDDTIISFINYGAGAVTFINGAGVTLTGTALLPGATGSIYPAAVVDYITGTTPSVNQGASAVQTVTGDVVDNTDPDNPVINLLGLQDLWIGASAMLPRATNGCAPVTAITIGNVTFPALAFDQTSQEFAHFAISLPRNWNNGTITFRPKWTAVSGTGTVQWGLSGLACRNDDALTGALGTAQTSDDSLIATNDMHIGPDSAAITLGGTPADDSMLFFEISRNPASDTLDADALLIGITITFTNDATHV